MKTSLAHKTFSILKPCDVSFSRIEDPFVLRVLTRKVVGRSVAKVLRTFSHWFAGMIRRSFSKKSSGKWVVRISAIIPVEIKKGRPFWERPFGSIGAKAY